MNFSQELLQPRLFVQNVLVKASLPYVGRDAAMALDASENKGPF